MLEYTCPKCAATYTTLQASALIDFRDGQFHCEHCQTVLITAEASDGTQGSHSAGRERLKAMKELQVCSPVGGLTLLTDFEVACLLRASPACLLWYLQYGLWRYLRSSSSELSAV